MAHTGGSYMGPFLKKLRGLNVLEPTQKGLEILGKALVKNISAEAAKDFAKRGWSLWDWDHKKKINESFRFEVVGRRTVRVLCSFPAITRLLDGVSSHKMTWLTQEQKDSYPSRYQLTKGERERDMKRGGRVFDGERLPLIVPIKDGGRVIFRTAPFKRGEAWVHPGIAKFTFLRRGIEKGKKEALEALGKEAVKNFLKEV